jgi:hypothetical protein
MVSTMRLTRSQASSSRLKPNLQISPANETLKPNVTFKPNTNVPNTSDGKPSLFLPLAAAHFSELKSIWGADQRMPTVSSRRSWAAARQLDPLKIHSWFSRKRVAAKKVGLAIPDEMYDMPVGTPPSLEAKEENSLGPPSRKRIKIRGFEEHSGGSRTESPTLTLAGPIYDPVTPSGSSVTALSSPSPKLADTRRNRAYSQSFDVPTKIFLDPAPPEWVDSINKTTASLTAVTAKNKLDQSLLTHAASSLSVSDGVEGHAVVQGSKGDQGSTSAAVDCLCILCTSPVPGIIFSVPFSVSS